MREYKEISQSESPFWGQLVCLGDENGLPCFWAKKAIMAFLSEQKQELVIALDLYCYNRNFVSSYSDERTQQINENIKNTYDIFMEDSASINDTFIREYNLDKDDWDLCERIDCNKDIFEKVSIQRIEILKNQYNIIFSLNHDEWAMTKKTSTGLWNLLPSSEVRYPEMEYRE